MNWEPFENAYEDTFGVLPNVRDILRRHVLGDPGTTKEFKCLFVYGDEEGRSFDRLQAKFRLLDTANVETERFARIVARTQKQEGVAYVEQRNWFGPSFSEERARELLLMHLGVCSDVEEPGFASRVAVSLTRSDPWPRWELVKDLTLGPYGRWLTAIDFSGLEEGHPPKDHARIIAAVLEFNRRHPENALAILYHVGESFEDKSLESAIRWVQEAAELGAHRLGHAIALGIDPAAYGAHERMEAVSERLDQLRYDLENADELRRSGVPVDEAGIESEMGKLRALPAEEKVAVEYDLQRLDEVRLRQAYSADRIRATGAVVEVCPTSNRRIGGITNSDNHPVHRFLSWSLPFVVGSDDAGIFDTTLADEIGWVVEAARLGEGAFDEIAGRAWRYRSDVLSGREPGPE